MPTDEKQALLFSLRCLAVIISKTKYGMENLKGRDHWEDLGAAGRILEWILGEQHGKTWTGYIWPRTGTGGGLL
jgi:hypothetical protein